MSSSSAACSTLAAHHAFAEAALAEKEVEQLAPISIFHRDRQVRWRQEDLHTAEVYPVTKVPLPSLLPPPKRVNRHA